ncbi:MAG: hypothetical protein NZ730_06605 [Porticoccaceae bacterium]|nr:hypothetical protein [Porticoccaceae bacterium]
MTKTKRAVKQANKGADKAIRKSKYRNLVAKWSAFKGFMLTPIKKAKNWHIVFVMVIAFVLTLIVTSSAEASVVMEQLVGKTH